MKISEEQFEQIKAQLRQIELNDQNGVYHHLVQFAKEAIAKHEPKARKIKKEIITGEEN